LLDEALARKLEDPGAELVESGVVEIVRRLVEGNGVG